MLFSIFDEDHNLSLEFDEFLVRRCAEDLNYFNSKNCAVDPIYLCPNAFLHHFRSSS